MQLVVTDAGLDRHEELALLSLADEEAERLLAGVPEKPRRECWWLVLAMPRLRGGDHDAQLRRHGRADTGRYRHWA